MKILTALVAMLLSWSVATQAQLSIEEVQAVSTDETIRIVNITNQMVDLTGWSLSVQRPNYSRQTRYSFPNNCIVPGRGELLVHSGPANINQVDDVCGGLNINLFWQAAFTLPNDAAIISLRTPDGLLESSFQYPPLYRAEEVQFRNDEVLFSGTMTIPNVEGQHPAVVMVSGSGPQDRNSDFFGFKTFEAIADHLSKNGIAVLRYDDRGVGGSTGNWAEATLDDRAADVISAIEFLKQHPSVDPKQIGIVGHSEGGVVGPMVAAQSTDVAFMVMIAGLGTTGTQLLKEQSELLMRAAGASEEAVALQLELLDLMYQAISTDAEEDWAVLVDRFRQAGIPNIDQQLALIQSNWYRSFTLYDPMPFLEKIQIPILAIFGSLDLQVPAASNQAGMEIGFEAAGNTNVTFHLFEGANHLFQLANTGSPQEYAALAKKFVDGFLELISSWLLNQSDDMHAP